MRDDQIDTSTHITRARRSTRPFTPDERKKKQSAFLKAFSEIGIIKYACRVAKIDRQTYYHWKNNDPEFQALLPDITDEANETLEYAAYEQSVLGVVEPVVSSGQVVYEMEPMLDEDGKQMFDSKGKPIMQRKGMITVRKYSPTLLITLLKARMPDK